MEKNKGKKGERNERIGWEGKVITCEAITKEGGFCEQKCKVQGSSFLHSFQNILADSSPVLQRQLCFHHPLLHLCNLPYVLLSSILKAELLLFQH